MLFSPPDGQPPTCVGAPEAGRVYTLVIDEHALIVIPMSSSASANGNRFLDQKCEKCGQPGVRFYDRQWCCESCGQDVLDRLTEELERPGPQRIEPTRPGQRRRSK